MATNADDTLVEKLRKRVEYLEQSLATAEKCIWDGDALALRNLHLKEAAEKLLNLTCSCAKDPEFKVLGHASWCDARKVIEKDDRPQKGE